MGVHGNQDRRPPRSTEQLWKSFFRKRKRSDGFQQRSDELVSQEVGTYISQSYGNHYDDSDGVFGVHDEAGPVLRAMPKATAMAQPNAPPAMS